MLNLFSKVKSIAQQQYVENAQSMSS